jgi:hypothetical protein
MSTPHRPSEPMRDAAETPAYSSNLAKLDPTEVLLKQVAEDDFAQYVDDLQAANRFKTFLIGNGTEIPVDLVQGLAVLSEKLGHEKREPLEVPPPSPKRSPYPDRKEE